MYVCMYVCIKLILEDMNINPYSPTLQKLCTYDSHTKVCSDISSLNFKIYFFVPKFFGNIILHILLCIHSFISYVI